MDHRLERQTQQGRASTRSETLTPVLIPTIDKVDAFATPVVDSSNLSPTRQGDNMDSSHTPDTSDEDVPKEHKTIVFLPPPQYPAIQFDIAGHATWGDNAYSLIPQTQNLVEAIRLRRHDQDRLLRQRILTVENSSVWFGMRLPAGVKQRDFLAAPKPSVNRARRQVVAIDCEMVGVNAGKPGENWERSELGQICAVDVLTGEILVNMLVLPAERVINWRKRFSGLSYPAMIQADKEGRLLRGWKAARTKLCSYIDTNTIIIGHSVENDLHMLRLAHSNIVDTSIQTAEAVFGDKLSFDRIWSLKDLAKALPKINIQNSRQGHDCVEDTLATREVALWAICYPEQLAAWAAQMRIDLKKKRMELEKKLKEQAKKRAAEKRMLEEAAMQQVDSTMSQLVLA
ncbi:hypothetical protein PFICI_12217 [Pestalotiopsis fici W106-1]|uniref:Exonuclease domain-containing protein n=1 Tax=Pestalotiopsis fici (strain W106-1 / CGMCC3.15140) TaxID=1229662 RepID=W3WN48_PESFW|nr:uncharacterized protein PFICI_12217 [Pestalotiopsis fici W106-1]ETS75273.1 hypothetical protein PFICI_12217 [Pestalotiopsis fici W106-1]